MLESLPYELKSCGSLSDLRFDGKNLIDYPEDLPELIEKLKKEEDLAKQQFIDPIEDIIGFSANFFCPEDKIEELKRIAQDIEGRS